MAEKSGTSTTDSKTKDVGTKDETRQEPKVTATTKLPIEELGARLDPAVFAGVREAQHWSAGKKVTKKTFDAAVQAFQEGGVDGTA